MWTSTLGISRLALLVMVVSSCVGSVAPVDDEPRERKRQRDDDDITPVECDVPTLLERKCSGSVCHGGTDTTPPQGVELVNTHFAEDLVDVPALAYREAVLNPEDCPSEPELFINSQSLSDSLMWTKLTNTHSCGDGMPIPYSVTKLSMEELDCVYQWMEELVLEKYQN